MPTTLYRYRPLTTYSLAELASPSIWFSSVGEFNDPFEFQFKIQSLQETPENREFVITSIQDETGMPRESVEAKLKTYNWDNFRDSIVAPQDNLIQAIRTQGVCCFSARNDSPLMWGHYAAAHTGFVVGYDTSCFPFMHALPVHYEERLCSFSIHDMIRRMHECLKQIVTQKGTDWSYEQEFRLINMQDQVNLAGAIDPAAIKSIYFGAMCTDQNRSLIGRVTSHLRPAFYGAQLDKERYAIHFQELEYDPQLKTVGSK
ncbi:DUF2971 domain-containing protein [candidate division KSB1 bacterium]|nr:DUF2971 domain-containing protein [candidate division KSB1 bacterium]